MIREKDRIKKERESLRSITKEEAQERVEAYKKEEIKIIFTKAANSAGYTIKFTKEKKSMLAALGILLNTIIEDTDITPVELASVIRRNKIINVGYRCTINNLNDNEEE